MGLPRSSLSSGRPLVRAPDGAGLSPALPAWGYHGRRSFGRRAHSRRKFIQAAGGLAFAGLATTRWTRTFAQDAGGANPKPIPAGFEIEGQVFHAYDYLPGNEPSTIGDFRGLVAINHLSGEGTVIRGGPNGGLGTPTPTRDPLPLCTRLAE